MTDTGEIREDARDRVMDELRASFRPEFLNRVDEIVLFKPLTLAEIEQIVDLQIETFAAAWPSGVIALELTEARVSSSPARATIRYMARARCDASSSARWKPGSPVR